MNPLRPWLLRSHLLFEDDADEEAFARSFCLANKPLQQVSLVIGGVFAYIFFVWDQVIDPVHSVTTHEIRGFFLTPMIWAAAGALFFIERPVAFERICSALGLIFASTLALMFHILSHGFDFGAAGEMLFLIFVYSLMPLRSSWVLLISLATWAVFISFEFFSPESKAGMMVVNNLMLGSTVVFGMFSTVSRELALRSRYATSGKLKVREQELDKMSETNRILRKTTERLLDAASINLLISYRRADSEAIAGRIRDRLANYFGDASVFMDIDSIAFGLDFREEIGLAARKTDVVLAVIGPNWLGKGSGDKARVWEDTDPVRIEIEAALERSIPIIPVLVLGATMPTPEDLPPTLRELSFRNAIPVDVGRDFHPHVDRLIRSLEVSHKSRRSNSTN